MNPIYCKVEKTCSLQGGVSHLGSFLLSSNARSIAALPPWQALTRWESIERGVDKISMPYPEHIVICAHSNMVYTIRYVCVNVYLHVCLYVILVSILD